MKILRYIAGLTFMLALLAADVYIGQNMFSRWFYLLLAAVFFAIVRLMAGKTNPDRALAFKAASIALTGFCVILAIAFKNDIYIEIAIAWTLQSFIATLFMAKYFGGDYTND